MNSAVTEVEKPRLSILDLLILITSVCVFFVVGENYDILRRYRMGVILRIEFAVLAGFAFGGLGICLNHWFKTKRVFDHPGYRLWFCLGLQQLTWLAASAFSLPTNMSFRGGQLVFNPVIFHAIIVLTLLGSVVVLLFGCLRDRWWWRLICLILVALFLTQSAHWIHRLFGFSPPTFLAYFSMPWHVILVLMISGVVCDYRAAEKRDWIHFAGVGCCLLSYVGSHLFNAVLFKFYSMQDLMIEV